MQLSEKKSDNKALYNIVDLCKVLVANNMEYIQLEESNIVYNENLDVRVMLPDEVDENLYKLEIYSEDKKTQEVNLDDETKSAEILLNESKNNIKVILYRDNQIVEEKEKQIYYIDPYKKQFLDKLENNGTTVHYRNGTMEKYEKDIDLLKSCGINYIRTDFIWKAIDIGGDNYNFEKYDKWITKAKELGLKIVAILNPNGENGGEDKKINNQEELDRFIKFVEKTATRYPEIIFYEIYNEPNLTTEYNGGAYITEEYMQWYSKAVIATKNKLKEINQDIQIISGSTAVSDASTSYVMESKEYFTNIVKYGAYDASDAFSYHAYDPFNNREQNLKFYSKLELHKSKFNEFGGFIKSAITEFGIPMKYEITENMQADKLIQQSSILDQYGMDMSLIYNFWNTNLDDSTNNYGLLYHNYTPKPSYYAIKNYYENTNGAEYIGTANIEDGLEVHVYNKDGKPKVIAWSNNSDKNISIPYENFTAKDIYGNDIQKDETSNLTITISPVYLDNISRTYFYQAISNTMKEKLEEFNTKFTEEITKVNGLSEKLQAQKQTAEDIGNHNESSEIAENTAIQYMKDFYGIGDTLIDEYKKGTLNIEDVKLSSMLDALNDIGDSYEDLITITAQIRNANFEETSKKIEEAENIVNNGEDLNNIYPSKILDFAKEFNEKATYINNLDEENDIKTGLIVSKNLHANLLADWAKQFADVYIDKYISENPITVTYSIPKEQLTNQDVKVTINKGDDTTITNNGGSNEWTFTTNGYYIFNYKRRGREGEIRAEVNNIDKEKPKIVNVELDKIYTETIKPLATDSNLEKVQLYNDDELIETYKNGDKISEEGLYKLIATDKAGNTEQIQFQILKKGSTEYIIQDRYIKNTTAGTTVRQFREKFPIRGEYVIRRNGRQVTENNTIATGDELEFNDSKQKYTLIVTGDINKDSEITVKDLTMLQSYILEKTELDDVQKLASDTNVDNKEIGVKDLVRMRIILLSN